MLYAVDLLVDAEIAQVYEGWLAAHVQELLGIEGFVGAQVWRMDGAPEGKVALCCEYQLADRAALQSYLEQHAARMRADGLARFGGRFSATRRVGERVLAG